MYWAGNVLCQHAWKAYQEALTTGAGDREPGRGEALVSIVFAAAALEALVNELYAACDQYVNFRCENEQHALPGTRLLAQLWNLNDFRRTATTHRYSIALDLLAEYQVDKGAEPYQSFKLLMDLRNELLHMKPSEALEMSEAGRFEVVRRPAIFDGCKRMGITYDPEDAHESWTSHVQTIAAARWSCRTIGHVMQQAIAACRHTEIALALHTMYEQEANELADA